MTSKAKSSSVSTSASTTKESSGKRGPEKERKGYKVIVRKLPPRDFREDDFGEAVKNACNYLGVPIDEPNAGMIQSNFCEGKMRLAM